MTRAQAQTIVPLLIAAGYSVSIESSVTDPLQVVVKATGPAINPQTVATFAANNGVTGTVTEATFS